MKTTQGKEQTMTSCHLCFSGKGLEFLLIGDGCIKEFHFVFKLQGTEALRVFSNLWCIRLISLFSGLIVPKTVIYFRKLIFSVTHLIKA